MQEGASYLIGTQDFRNLCKMDVSNGVTEFKREILSAVIKQCSFSHNDAGSMFYCFYLKLFILSIFKSFFFIKLVSG